MWAKAAVIEVFVGWIVIAVVVIGLLVPDLFACSVTATNCTACCSTPAGSWETMCWGTIRPEGTTFVPGLWANKPWPRRLGSQPPRHPVEIEGKQVENLRVQEGRKNASHWAAGN